MVREIVRDTMFLSMKSEPAVKADKHIADDLTDTLNANAQKCVGMAANMIGERKRIIAVNDCGKIIVMYNPEITDHTAARYEVEEGCLSLDGERRTLRYNTIEVEYLDARFKKQRRVFKGDTAEIIQHETDHLDGIII